MTCRSSIGETLNTPTPMRTGHHCRDIPRVTVPCPIHLDHGPTDPLPTNTQTGEMNSPVDVTTGISTIPGVTTTGDTAPISCDNRQDLQVTIFNCKGFKQWFTYCTALLENVTVYVYPRLGLDQILTNNVDGNFDVYAKSGMLNIEPDYMCRQLGGVTIICQRNSNLTYRELIPSDRIVAVCISDKNGKPLQIILNVYMPFFNGSSRPTELFIKKLDIMQGFLVQYATIAPVKIVGDYNVQLPRCHDWSKNWHRLPGFNRHSATMYDFLVSNDLAVVDFQFKTNDQIHVFLL